MTGVQTCALPIWTVGDGGRAADFQAETVERACADRFAGACHDTLRHVARGRLGERQYENFFRGAARAMQQAIDEAGITPAEVAYVNAHGTATHANDSGEAHAIQTVFGEGSEVKVSSTKGMTGHLLGAAGAIEAILTVAALEQGRSEEHTSELQSQR